MSLDLLYSCARSRGWHGGKGGAQHGAHEFGTECHSIPSSDNAQSVLIIRTWTSQGTVIKIEPPAQDSQNFGLQKPSIVYSI
jgi:hypothetical protein